MMAKKRVQLKTSKEAQFSYACDSEFITTELTEEIMQDMFAYLKMGYPMNTSCGLLGISKATHARWQQQGQIYIEDREQGRSPNPAHAIYAFYVIEINRATAQYLTEKIDNLNGDLNPSWVRDMTILERRDWQNWSRNVIVADREESSNPDESFL